MSDAITDGYRMSRDQDKPKEKVQRNSPCYFYDRQYNGLIKQILAQGEWIENKRTGIDCLTIARADFKYDGSSQYMPAITTRYAPWKTAIREITGYIRGYFNAHDFEALGCNTWLENAYAESWLSNPHCNDDGDMGQAYRFRPIGYVPMVHRDYDNASPEEIAAWEGTEPDQLRRVYEMLLKREDDRGLIVNAWRPETFEKSCLRPCMYKWHFTLIGETLTLHVEQRSVDCMLGLVSNMIQAWFLLRVMAHITGLKPGQIHHTLINCHIYRNQYDVLMEEKQTERATKGAPRMRISNELKTLEDLETFAKEDFDKLFVLETPYETHPNIIYPFAV